MENEKSIPKGWKQVKLGEYVISIKGKKPKHVSAVKTKECSIPYINIKAFEKNIIDEYTDGTGCVLCEDGDFLMVWDGSRSGYVGKAIKGALGSTLVKLNFPDMYNNYAYYFLQSKYLDINTRAKGVGIPHVDPNILWNYDLLIPPKPIQQAIVSKIEELFRELDESIETLHLAQQQLKTYRQSVLKWAFGGKLTNKYIKKGEFPKKWKWMRSGDFFDFVTSGSRGWAKYYSDKGAIFIRITNLNFDSLELDLEERKIQYVNPPLSSEGIRTKVQEGDFLFSITGYLGMLAIAPKLDNAYVNQHVCLCRPKNDFNKKYLGYWIISKSGAHHYLNKNQKGAVKAGLNLDDLKTFPVPLCPIEEQNNIVQEIEKRLSVADKMEESVNQSLQQAEALRQSILKKAFEGKLIVEQPKTQAKIFPFERKVLAGKIIHLLHDDRYFGLTKFQKTFCVAEHYAEVEYEINYLQERAGPYDKDFTWAFRKEAVEKDWFREETKISMTRFTPGNNVGKLIKDYAKYFREKSAKITFILKLFKDKTLLESELIATLYAVWNNRIICKNPITEADLVADVYKWSTEKKKYEEEEIKYMFKWMNEVKLIPTGFGNVINK